MIVVVVYAFLGAKDLLTKPIGLESAELFGSIKHKSNMMHYSIARMSTQDIKAHIEESLSNHGHDVQHGMSCRRLIVIRSNGTLFGCQ